jgi:hypothetical protein
MATPGLHDTSGAQDIGLDRRKIAWHKAGAEETAAAYMLQLLSTFVSGVRNGAREGGTRTSRHNDKV